MANDRRYSFVFICYPESCPDIGNKIQALNPVKWAYILHDKDLDENGDVKKAHYHVFLQFANARSVNFVVDFGIKPQQVLNKRIYLGSVIKYFVHAENMEKFQYTVDDIRSNFDVKKYLVTGEQKEAVEMTEFAKVLEIIDDLVSEENESYMELVRRAIAAGCFSTFRRNSSFFCNALSQSYRKVVVTYPLSSQMPSVAPPLASEVSSTVHLLGCNSADPADCDNQENLFEEVTGNES